MSTPSKLFITLGDPLSINVELLLKVLGEFNFSGKAVILVGSYFQWMEQSSKLGYHLELQKVDAFKEAQSGGLSFYDIGGEARDAESLTLKERGEIAVRSLSTVESYIKAHPDEKIAIVTCPIDKFAASEAGFDFPGHTEYFSHVSQCPTLMLLAGPKLRVGLATNHCALRKVPDFLSRELLTSKLEILRKALRELLHIPHPRIAVAALNPHCGDGGLFGDEEETLIEPVISDLGKRWKQEGTIEGPISADSIFAMAYHGRFDAVLAMYHDQGLGPLKTLHFEEAVNVTCGLPYLRVSPDHGPARDLFLKNEASSQSMHASMTMALDYLGES